MKRVILIAGIGTSPAVLTETVWALAHGEKPVVPDEVVVVTTRTGKRKVRDELMGGVWAEMKDALCRQHVKGAERLQLGETSIRVLPDAEGNEIDDLRSSEDNLRAADFMLGVVRQYTEDPGTVVYASIAGGRKTMSALLFSCMNLLGRADDKIFHVLTTPEAMALKPAFHFPRRGVKHEFFEAGIPKRILSSKVKIELFEVPFVKVRGLFQEKFKKVPPRYSEMVDAVQELTPAAELPLPEIVLDVENGSVKIGDRVLSVHANEFALLFLMGHGVVDAEDIFDHLIGACAIRGRDAKALPVWFSDFRDSAMMNAKFDGRKPEPSLVNKLASRLRKTLNAAGLDESTLGMLVPKRSKMMTYPKEKLVFSGARLADIRGYLLPAVDGE